MSIKGESIELVIIITPEERKSFSSFESFIEAMGKIAQGRSYYLTDSPQEILTDPVSPSTQWIRYSDTK